MGICTLCIVHFFLSVAVLLQLPVTFGNGIWVTLLHIKKIDQKRYFDTVRFSHFNPFGAVTTLHLKCPEVATRCKVIQHKAPESHPLLFHDRSVRAAIECYWVVVKVWWGEIEPNMQLFFWAEWKWFLQLRFGLQRMRFQGNVKFVAVWAAWSLDQLIGLDRVVEVLTTWKVVLYKTIQIYLQIGKTYKLCKTARVTR